jgi:predicted ferric reductase
MSASYLDGHRVSAPAVPLPARRHRRPTVRRWAPDVAAAAGGLGFGAAIALPLANAVPSTFAAPGGLATLVGDVTAMGGTYLLLVMVLLAARIPALETAVGQDRLLRWHRRLSSAPLVLLGLHGVLTVLGFAQADRTNWFGEAGSLITSMSWIFAAVVAYAMLVGIAGLSIRATRRRFSYDTWWVIHLYTYLGLAFSIPHQIVDGNNFVGHPLVQAAWLVFWFATAGVVVVYRLGLPIARSLRHGLQVVEVREEAPGVFSLIVGGRDLDKLPVAGGQYFGWRFLTRGLWWHAHPFSLSAAPAPPFLRVTIKTAGDDTAKIAALRPGTLIAIEGPYGAFTEAARVREKVALIGAGVGITPLRALLEDLPHDVDVVAVQRASAEVELIHESELRHLVAARGGRLLELVGSRHEHPLDDPRHLRRLIPDLRQRDVYVCGPEGFAAGVVAAARRVGVRQSAIHREAFEF